jgi:hypothetical protein
VSRTLRICAVMALLALMPLRVAHGAPNAGGSVPSGCVAPLLLDTVPGPINALIGHETSVTPRPAADIPPGPAAVRLPLYPLARPSTRVIPTLSPLLSSRYRKVASANFVASTAYRTVLAWYASAFQRCRWLNDGTEPLQRGLAGLEFISRDGLQRVSLTVQPDGAQDTRIRYVVQVLALAPRPADTLVHGPFVRVEIVFHLYRAHRNRTSRYTVTWPATISRLIAAIDAPTTVFDLNAAGPGGAVALSHAASVTLVRADGSTIHVYVRDIVPELIVNHTRPLFDPNYRVTRLLQRITHRRCPTPSACRR